MVHPIRYRVDGTTAVEDSDVLRTGGGESNHHESNSSSSNSNSKKRVYSNDSSGEPSIKTPANARGAVLTLRNDGHDFIFTSRRSVVYPPSTDSYEFSLSQSQHSNVLAFTVLTTHPDDFFVTPNFGFVYPEIAQKLCIEPRHDNATRRGDRVKILIRITEADESILKTAEQIFRGDSNVAVKEDVWSKLSTGGCFDIKLSLGGSVSTGIGIGGALEERANKRTKLASADENSGVLINGESVVSGEVNDVDMGGDGKGADNGCGIDLFMDLLNGSDLASYLTVTDLCNVALANSKCYQAMKKKLDAESAWDCALDGCDEQFSDFEDACEHELTCKHRKKDGGSGAAASSAVSSSRTTSDTVLDNSNVKSVLEKVMQRKKETVGKEKNEPKKVQTTPSSTVPSVTPKQTESKKSLSTFVGGGKKKKADPSSSKVAPKPATESKVSSKPTLSTLTKSKPAPVASTKSSTSTSGDAIASLLSAMETNPELNFNLSSGTVSFVTEIACKYDIEGMDDVFDEDDDDHITRAAKYHIKNPNMKRPDLLRDFCKVKDPQKKLINRLRNKTLKLDSTFQMDNKSAKANKAKAKSTQATKKRNQIEGASSRKRSAEIIAGIGK